MLQLQWGNEVANDMHITLSQLQLQSGMTKPVMEHPEIWLPHIEQGWLSHVRERLKVLDACIEIEDAWVPVL